MKIALQTFTPIEESIIEPMLAPLQNKLAALAMIEAAFLLVGVLFALIIGVKIATFWIRQGHPPEGAFNLRAMISSHQEDYAVAVMIFVCLLLAFILFT